MQKIYKDPLSYKQGDHSSLSLLLLVNLLVTRLTVTLKTVSVWTINCKVIHPSYK